MTPTVSAEDRVVALDDLRETHARLRLLDDGHVKPLAEGKQLRRPRVLPHHRHG